MAHKEVTAIQEVDDFLKQHKYAIVDCFAQYAIKLH